MAHTPDYSMARLFTYEEARREHPEAPITFWKAPVREQRIAKIVIGEDGRYIKHAWRPTLNW